MQFRVTAVSGLVCALVVAGVATAPAGNAASSGGASFATSLAVSQVPTTVTTTGSVSGVVRGSNGRAVAGYTVEAFTADGNFVLDTVTNASGSYTLASLPSGPYRVRVSGPRTGAAPWAIGWFGGSSFLKAKTLNVGGPLVKADVVLVAGATVTGQVAKVARGSQVRLCGESFLDCRASVTDARGAFVVRGLPAGTASIVVRPVGGTDLAFPQEPPRAGVSLRAGQTVTLALDAATQAAPVITIAGKPLAQSPPRPPADVSPPTVISVVSSEDSGRRYVATRATDGRGGGGLAQVQLRVGGEEQRATRYTSQPLLVPGDGEVSVRVIDKAGNASDWVVAP